MDGQRIREMLAAGFLAAIRIPQPRLTEQEQKRRMKAEG